MNIKMIPSPVVQRRFLQSKRVQRRIEEVAHQLNNDVDDDVDGGDGYCNERNCTEGNGNPSDDNSLLCEGNNENECERDEYGKYQEEVRDGCGDDDDTPTIIINSTVTDMLSRLGGGNGDSDNDDDVVFFSDDSSMSSMLGLGKRDTSLQKQPIATLLVPSTARSPQQKKRASSSSAAAATAATKKNGRNSIYDDLLPPEYDVNAADTNKDDNDAAYRAILNRALNSQLRSRRQSSSPQSSSSSSNNNNNNNAGVTKNEVTIKKENHRAQQTVRAPVQKPVVPLSPRTAPHENINSKNMSSQKRPETAKSKHGSRGAAAVVCSPSLRGKQTATPPSVMRERYFLGAFSCWMLLVFGLSRAFPEALPEANSSISQRYGAAWTAIIPQLLAVLVLFWTTVFFYDRHQIKQRLLRQKQRDNDKENSPLQRADVLKSHNSHLRSRAMAAKAHQSRLLWVKTAEARRTSLEKELSKLQEEVLLEQRQDVLMTLVQAILASNHQQQRRQQRGANDEDCSSIVLNNLGLDLFERKMKQKNCNTTRSPPRKNHHHHHHKKQPPQPCWNSVALKKLVKKHRKKQSSSDQVLKELFREILYGDWDSPRTAADENEIEAIFYRSSA